MQYKLKHRLSAALMAGAMCCTMIPAASADEIATPETADTAVPEVTDSAAPDISQITENLYNDLPDAPTGSYLGSMGLPVATGETKISISAWVSDLYDGADAHIDADALNEDETTIITLTFIIRPQATHGRLWRWLVRKLLAAPKFRTCRVLLSRSIILLHGPLLHRAPEAALI